MDAGGNCWGAWVSTVNSYRKDVGFTRIGKTDGLVGYLWGVNHGISSHQRGVWLKAGWGT